MFHHRACCQVLHHRPGPVYPLIAFPATVGEQVFLRFTLEMGDGSKRTALLASGITEGSPVLIRVDRLDVPPKHYLYKAVIGAHSLAHGATIPSGSALDFTVTDRTGECPVTANIGTASSDGGLIYSCVHSSSSGALPSLFAISTLTRHGNLYTGTRLRVASDVGSYALYAVPASAHTYQLRWTTPSAAPSSALFVSSVMFGTP